MLRVTWFLGTVLIAVALFLAGAPARAQSILDLNAQRGTMEQGYLLGPGDVIDVNVVGREDYKLRAEVQVDGSILLPFLKSVPAANRTLSQLELDIARRLKEGGFYNDPVVSVTLEKAASRYITVLGDVGTPGLIPLDRTYRVSDILARVGGAKDAQELFLRRASGQEVRLSVRGVASGGPSEDPVVSAGDKLYVPSAPTFYIYGQVSAPGSYHVDPEMTLRKALARGGGLTARGSEHRIKVYRDGREMMHFSLGEPIKGGDTIVVGQRLF